MKLKFKKIREENNLSRKEFAVILGCSMSHVINVEKGAARLTDDFKAILEDHFNLPENFFGQDDAEAPVNTYEYDRIIGENVCFYRKHSGFTQQELAETMGYSQASSVSAIERGKKPIGKKKLMELAEIFGIHISELFSIRKISDFKDHDALLNKFLFILSAKTKPAAFEEIKLLIEVCCEELKKRGPV